MKNCDKNVDKSNNILLLIITNLLIYSFCLIINNKCSNHNNSIKK